MAKEGFASVAVSLPQYEPGTGSGWGTEFPDFIQAVHALVISIQATRSAKLGKVATPVIVIGHDWGAVNANLYCRTYPQEVRSLVLLDVGAHLNIAEQGIYAILFVVMYQSLLASMFLLSLTPSFGIGRYIADAVSRWFAGVGKAPNPSIVGARMNYFYYYLMRNAIFAAVLRRNPNMPAAVGDTPEARSSAQCPILFMYGEGKPFQFYSRSWLRYLQDRDDGSDVVPVQGGGHWFAFKKQHEETVARVLSFIRSI
jgi:pimeloyl-ACP methyl ester carboxylesterase